MAQLATLRLAGTPLWAFVLPLIGVIMLIITWGRELNVVLVILGSLALIASIVTAVHHAEVVAHRVGEPFGALILAVAVTVIEVGLIVTLMISGGAKTASLPRDTVFSAVMITCNLIIGLCLLVGPIKHWTVRFSAQGSTGALAVLVGLVTLTMVLPTFTTSRPGPVYTPLQLGFAGAISAVLYGVFVFVQTVRHRDFFLPVDVLKVSDSPEESRGEHDHVPPPSNRTTLASLGLMLICLVAVVGLAKSESPALEGGLSAAGAPPGVIGVAIALIVLAPETTAAVRAAARNRLQTSLNLALGSGMASIGLTIPVIAVASIWLPTELELGLRATDIDLFGLTVVVAILTLTQGRATVLQGVVHLAVFVSYVFIAFNP
ncbi:MAG: ionic transporter y4hA [Microlunatus sp.]|nr:ionic transporter y4hA [Microlunatus sp.]